MKNHFTILTDGVADLPASWLYDHPYVRIIDTPFCVTEKNGEAETINFATPDDFAAIHERVKKHGARVTTSLPTVYDPDRDSASSVETVTRKLLQDGDVIYVVMNSSLSSTYNSVRMLYSDLALSNDCRNTGHRAVCVDSHCMGTGLGLLIIELCKAYDHGEVSTVGEMVDFVEKNRGYIGHFFTWKELSYLRMSGRVDLLRAAIADLLGIRLIGAAEYVSQDERKLEVVNPHTIIRGLSRWADIIGIYAKRHIADPNGTIIISHGNAPHDAEVVAYKLMDYLPNAHYLFGPEWRCGPVIQCHGGPTSLHVNFVTDDIYRRDGAIIEFEDIIRKRRLV